MWFGKCKKQLNELMNDSKNIQKIILPEPTLRRLPWYLAYIRMLDNQNIEYVSSTQIAKEINVDASQIAKDLSFLNIKGKTRIGYEVHSLVRELVDFLGFKRKHRAFMIGVGSLGAALMQDVGLAQYGLNIVAGFDTNDEIAGKSICGGLKAIWNFTPYRIKAPANIVIQNTSIYAHLALMYNRMDEMNNK